MYFYISQRKRILAPERTKPSNSPPPSISFRSLRPNKGSHRDMQPLLTLPNYKGCL